MTKTNQYGQPVDDKQHVLKTRDLIAEDIFKKIEPVLYAIGKDTTYQQALAVLVPQLADHVMEYSNKDWSANVRHGVSLGRKDAIVMLKALAAEAESYVPVDDMSVQFEEKVIPLDELQKVITALEGTA